MTMLNGLKMYGRIRERLFSLDYNNAMSKLEAKKQKLKIAIKKGSIKKSEYNKEIKKVNEDRKKLDEDKRWFDSKTPMMNIILNR